MMAPHVNMRAEYGDLGTSGYEEIDHDDSTTEVSDTHQDEEKGWCRENGRLNAGSKIRHQSSRVGRLGSSILSLRSLLDTVLLLVILVLVVDRRLNQRDERYGSFEGSGDLTGFAPRISQRITTFKPDFFFAPENTSEFFASEVQEKWLELVPKGLGYVNIDHPEQYNNLPTPLSDFNSTVFTTAMTHQLHCLYAIIEVYSGITSNNKDKVPEETPWHLNHCFEYLRQSIMCCGDTALEGQATTFPEGVTGSDGWDAKHVCKDYGQIYEYLEENRANDDVWI